MVNINKIDIEQKFENLYDCIGSIDIDGNGVVSVKGTCILKRKILTLGITFGTILGKFSCSDCGIRTLKGGPTEVAENYYCNQNLLTSLEGAPKIVGGGFYCHQNKLRNLEHSPQTVNGSFDCSENLLTNLKGAPESIPGDFMCFDSDLLTSLDGIPNTDKAVGFTYSPNLPFLRLIAYKEVVIYVTEHSDDSTYTDMIEKWRDAEGSLRSRIIGFQNELIAKGLAGNAKW